MNSPALYLPEEWSSLLQLDHPTDLNDLIGPSLINPLKDFLRVPGKNIRPSLVELGFRLASAENEESYEKAAKKLEIASLIVESIHAGALIVDDIQDGSSIRRNSPSLHIQHGLPKALNAGNWLYFWGLEQIRHLNLTSELSESLTFDCIHLMTRAHYGQAVDVGTSIDCIPQQRVKDLCLASMELKTGTLMSLAFRLGGAINNISQKDNSKLSTLGSKLGVALQMYDDIGNFLQDKVNGPSKRHEDLRLRRPSWAWAMASTYSYASYEEFITAIINLPCEDLFNEWVKKNNFKEVLLTSTQKYLKETISAFEIEWKDSHPRSMEILYSIQNKLENSYVKTK